MQMLTIQSFDTGSRQCARGWAGDKGGIGRPHFLSGLLLSPPTTMRIGPTPVLVEASRTVRDATVRILVLEKPEPDQAPGLAAEPSACPSGSTASSAAGARGLAERLVQWAAPAQCRLVGSFTCAISRLVCNLVGDVPMVRHADESRFCRNALPLGFSFVAATGTPEARDAIAGLMADSRHPFLPVAAEPDGEARLPLPTAFVLLQSRTQVLLSVAGLFEHAEPLPESAQFTRVGFRKLIRAESSTANPGYGP